MPKAKFEFQVKRGVVDIDSDEDSSEVINKCIALGRKNDHQRAVEVIMPNLNFE